jgi:DNA-binding PadR family transcriptional regulator
MLATLRSIRADQWTKLNPSAIYYTFERLDSLGMIRKKGTRRAARRPEHTVYEITSDGRAHLAELLKERFVDLIPLHPPIYPAVLYSHRLEPSVLVSALSQRIEMLSWVIDTLENALAQYDGEFGEPLRQLLRHAIQLNRAEIAWCREFSLSAQSGALYEDHRRRSDEAL